MAHVVLDYQKAAVRAAEGFGGRALLALEPGLGKTLVTLHCLRRCPDAWPAVVVCPAGVKSHWAHEAMAQIGVRGVVLEGRKAPKELPNIDTHKLVIVNYDILDGWLSFLRKLRPRTIVVDECHNIANRQTVRAKATRSLAMGCPYVLALSGTPLLNRPAELWPVLNLVRPDAFPSFWSFAQSYCAPKHRPWGWEYKGASNLPQLYETLLSSCMVRYRKADVLNELPDKVRRVELLPLSTPSEYALAETDFLRWLASREAGRVDAAEKAQKLTQMGYLKRLAASLKMPAMVDWVHRFLSDSDEKIVVFAVHRAVIEYLRNSINHKSVVVDGSVSQTDRQHAIRQFALDKNTRVFIGNIQAAGVGINGLQVAQTCAFAELAWRPGDHIQAEDRCHRMGQAGGVFAHYLVAAGTIEEHLCEIIQHKQTVLANTLDGGPQGDELDIYTQLEQRLLQRGNFSQS